MHLDRKVSLNP